MFSDFTISCRFVRLWFIKTNMQLAIVLQLLTFSGVCLVVLAGSTRRAISHRFTYKKILSKLTRPDEIQHQLRFGRRDRTVEDEWKDYDETTSKPGENGAELSIDDLPSDCGSYLHVKRRGSHNRTSSARIAGGTHAYAGAFPSFAYLPNDYKNGFCGGVIIHKRYILTAAHCVVEDPSFKQIGVGSIYNNENLIDVDRICVNDDYHGTNRPSDIAILGLKQDIPFSWEVQPACLPLSEPSSEEMDRMTSVGMGLTDESYPLPITLSKLDVQWASCEHITNPNLICFADRRGESQGRICRGDSGSGTYFLRDGKQYVATVTSGTMGTGCHENHGQSRGIGIDIFYMGSIINRMLKACSVGSGFIRTRRSGHSNPPILYV